MYCETTWMALFSMLASAFTFHAQQLKAAKLPTFPSSMLLYDGEGAAVPLPGPWTCPPVLCPWLLVGMGSRCSLDNTAH